MRRLASSPTIAARGSTASLWLSEEQLAKRDYPNIEAAVEAIDQDDINALVYDAPVLRYQRSKVGPDRVRLVGPIFTQSSMAWSCRWEARCANR
jgi:polar amino acid transport system substrate-binding protein